MVHIANLSLALFSLWTCLIIASDTDLLSIKTSLGIPISFLISLIAIKFKLITTNLFFLNIGFYRYFLLLLLKSFITAIPLIIRSLFYKETGSLHYANISNFDKNSIKLLIASIIISPGTSFIGFSEKNIVIYAINNELVQKLNIPEIARKFQEIDDSRLT